MFGWLAGCNDYNNSIQYNTGATLTNISPSGLPAGTDSFLLTVNANVANGFNNTTVIQWNGQKLATSLFVDTITMTATVPASLLAKPGTAFVNTLTKQSGTGQNGLSNTLAFNIYGAPNPVPTLTSVTPGSAPACGTSCTNAAVTITVVGTNFLPGSNNGGSLVTLADKLTPMQQPASLTITSFSDTQIQAVIPGAFLANPDTATISVLNPGNGFARNPVVCHWWAADPVNKRFVLRSAVEQGNCVRPQPPLWRHQRSPKMGATWRTPRKKISFHRFC